MAFIARLALVLCLASVVSAQTKVSQPALKGTTALDVYANGDRIELLVAEDQAAGQVLVHRHSTDGGVSWSAPVSIEPSRGKLVNPGRNTDPQIVAAGQRLIAVWTSPGTVSQWGGGNLATAVSADGGKTWRPGGTPNDDPGGDEHAFIDVVADSKGVSHLVWLDARDGKMGLRFSSSRDGGASWAANQSLDAETCECCWNTLATGWDDALLALYRDIPRDMALAREIATLLSAAGDKVSSDSLNMARSRQGKTKKAKVTVTSGVRTSRHYQRRGSPGGQ